MRQTLRSVFLGLLRDAWGSASVGTDTRAIDIRDVEESRMLPRGVHRTVVVSARRRRRARHTHGAGLASARKGLIVRIRDESVVSPGALTPRLVALTWRVFLATLGGFIQGLEQRV